MHMVKTVLKCIGVILFICGLLAVSLPAQERQSGEKSAYGSKFFDELRTIFGRFRDMDLQRVFLEAQPIQCSELLGRKGEWRPVAFFNEDRKLGDWCRESLQEVKNDLEVYVFKGSCKGDQDSIEVTTEFPTAESMEDFNLRKINLNQMDITVNDPAKVLLNRQTMAYTFELPYLFLTGQRGSLRTYSFNAPNRNSAYAPEVSGRWECKMVSSKEVAYRFLICRTTTVPRGSAGRNRKFEPSFGSAAFYILSDGMEAQTSVKVLTSDGNPSSENPEDTSTTPVSPARPSLIREEKVDPVGR
jgi:hypothetical protein